MDLKRDIYRDLLRWKKENSGRVLELEGARQVGKTYILDKFASENYKRYYYINMLQTSGQDYLQCLHTARKWEPGRPRKEKPLLEAFRLFDDHFTDDEETVVVIDEIQDSPEVYSCIRQFAREFQCHFIVTGSYLGKTLEKEYFLPAGDTDKLVMNTLSYEEFLEAVGKREQFEHIGLYGEGDHRIYDELKTWYDIYMQTGGYPAVVKKYLETSDPAACVPILTQIIDIFIQESKRYFSDIVEMNLFEQLLPAIAQTMLKEKKGNSDLITELSGIIFKKESGRITKKSVNQAIAWLYHSHIIGYCGKVINGNMVEAVMNMRFYFRDVGVARYFLDRAGASPSDLDGMLSENFVYLYLLRKCRSLEIAGMEPMFGEYKEGEIDFFVNSRLDYCNYGVEVKSGKSIGRTANLLLQDGKVQYVYLLKGNTYGGISEDGKYTVPIYLAGRIAFDKGTESAESR